MTTRTSSAQQAQRALVAARRERALRLKVDGNNNTDIGLALAADPTINSAGVPWPEGYGADRYAKGLTPPSNLDLSRMVSQDVSRALKDAQKTMVDAGEEWRTLEAERLERLAAITLAKALEGDLTAVGAALKVMERRAKLLGLDAQVNRTELTGKDGGPLEATSVVQLLALADALSSGVPDGNDGDDGEDDGDE